MGDVGEGYPQRCQIIIDKRQILLQHLRWPFVRKNRWVDSGSGACQVSGHFRGGEERYVQSVSPPPERVVRIHHDAPLTDALLLMTVTFAGDVFTDTGKRNPIWKRNKMWTSSDWKVQKREGKR